MGDFFTPQEWEELNRIGINGIKKRARYKNRFSIYANIIATLSLCVSIAALIISIIALSK